MSECRTLFSRRHLASAVLTHIMPRQSRNIRHHRRRPRLELSGVGRIVEDDIDEDQARAERPDTWIAWEAEERVVQRCTITLFSFFSSHVLLRRTYALGSVHSAMMGATDFLSLFPLLLNEAGGLVWFPMSKGSHVRAGLHTYPLGMKGQEKRE